MKQRLSFRSGLRLALTLGIAAAIAGPVLAAVGSWSAGPDMSTARYAATATTLPGGKILVAGGYNGVQTVTSAQLFDPGMGAWSATGSLKKSRNFATETLLPNGTVLIAGGYTETSSSAGSLNTAEIYNPSTGAFAYATYTSRNKTYISYLTTARELFTATLLPDGKVLLVGGFKTGIGGGTLKSAELYDPTTGKFTATGSMTSTGTYYGRFGQAALLIPGTSKVLVVGGKERRSSSDWRSLATAEIYDQATGAFTQVGSMTYRRDRPSVVWVSALGKALVIGGKSEAPGEATFTPTPTEWFDPVTETFSPGPSLNQGRMAHSQVTLSDASVVVAGGWCQEIWNTTGSAERLLTSSAADPASYYFDWAGAAQADGSVQMMAQSCHDHVAVALPGDRVLVAGGKRVDSAGTFWLKRSEFYSK